MSFMVSRSAEFNLAARFLKHAIVHKNNSSTMKDKRKYVNKNELYWSDNPMGKMSATTER